MPTIAEQFECIAKKVASGDRLTAADGELLFRPEVDLHALGALADGVRKQKHGRRTYYNINAHLNPTNVCIYRCALCAYSCEADDPRAYVMTEAEVLRHAAEAAAAGCTELHIVGGIHPTKPFGWYRDLLAMVHQSQPRLHLKAFTAVEIARFAELSRRPVVWVLQELIAAGLGSLPGGGAEIFAPEVRTRLCPRKADADCWLEVHRTAHELQLRTNATMLYGHIEQIEHRVDHLVRLRRQQDASGGFQAFVPLSFHPENTAFAHIVRPSALDDLRTLAISRLMLDNFDHVKAYWITLGVGVAQTALGYGADDLDGTVRQERIHHDAGSTTPQTLTVDEICRLVREAGCEPIERDSLYRPVLRAV